MAARLLDGVLTALHFPGDGSVNPGYAAIAFAKLAADGEWPCARMSAS